MPTDERPPQGTSCYLCKRKQNAHFCQAAVWQATTTGEMPLCLDCLDGEPCAKDQGKQELAVPPPPVTAKKKVRTRSAPASPAAPIQCEPVVSIEKEIKPMAGQMSNFILDECNRALTKEKPVPLAAATSLVPRLVKRSEYVKPSLGEYDVLFDQLFAAYKQDPKDHALLIPRCGHKIRQKTYAGLRLRAKEKGLLLRVDRAIDDKEALCYLEKGN